ncbi:hypothetical protein Mithridates_00174 [Acinetobacter phage Mithridates]|nr:hypothetical protein Mithridates_00174 [Acinetobacter phage Mithridates]
MWGLSEIGLRYDHYPREPEKVKPKVKPKVGDKIRFVKNRYVGLSFGIPVGSVGKVIHITEDCGNEHLYQVQNPNWIMANQGICSFWIDEIEVI